MPQTSPIELVLFHSVLGVRPAVSEWAERIRTAGFTVHVPDLYGGRVFDSHDEGMAFVESIGGIPALIERTHHAATRLPQTVVYAGFSNGGASAELLALVRPGALGALLFHAALPIAAFGAASWPPTVPIQVHFAEHDPRRDEGAVQALRASVLASGASFELFEYPIEGHLFADSGLPEYDFRAADLMLDRAISFLDRIGRAA